MTTGNVTLFVLLSLPLIVFLIRRGFYAWLGTVLVLWLVAATHDWDPTGDNNWGAATLALGWVPIAVYCALCYALAGLIARLKSRVAACRRNRGEQSQRSGQ